MREVRRRGNPEPPDRPALLQERQQLLARLAEIERLLGRPETAVTRPPEVRGA